MQTVFTAYFSAVYDSGILLVGTFSTREKAEAALKEYPSSCIWDIPKILVQTLDVVVHKTDDDPTINAIVDVVKYDSEKKYR